MFQQNLNKNYQYLQSQQVIQPQFQAASDQQGSLNSYFYQSLNQINDILYDDAEVPGDQVQQQQSTFPRKKKQFQADVNAKTKVLLICIFNKKSTLVRHDMLYRLFSQYGQVQKILIFEKSKIWKSFIEMGNKDQAELCKEKLNNFHIFEDGSKMSVYYSNMQELQFQNNNSGGVDYTNLESQVKQQVNQDGSRGNISSQSTVCSQSMLNGSLTALSSLTQFPSSLANIQELDSQEFIPFISNNYAKTPQSNEFKVKINLPSVLNQGIKDEDSKTQEVNKEDKRKKILEEIENNLQTEQQQKIEYSLQKIDHLIERKNINNNSQAFDPSNYVNPLYIQENKKSKVIYIRGLEDPYLNVNQLYNIFSNFGNINKIIFLRNKKSCLIEYQSKEYATNAKDFLNNKQFNNNLLKIFYSNYEEINLKRDQAISDDIFLGTEETFRFKQNKQMCINPPSITLHISNLKKEACNEQFLIDLFSKYGKVMGIKIIIQQNCKNMCLIKMGSIEQAICCVAYLHGQFIFGRKIHVSFTHSKI